MKTRSMTKLTAKTATSSSDDGKQSTISRCHHLDICQSLTDVQLDQATNKKHCEVCDYTGANRWLCLHDSCRLIFCGLNGRDHSQQHYEETNKLHCLAINLKNDRVYCNACDCEVRIDNIPKWTDSIRNILNKRQLLSNRVGLGDVDQQITVIDNQNTKQQSQSVCIGREYRTHSDNIRQEIIEDECGDLSPRGLTGLRNLGNTCYMNAALQALSNSRAFVDYFRELKVLTDVKSITGTESGVVTAYQQLVSTMWSKSRIGHASAYRLLTTVRSVCPQFRGLSQQDAQEFIRCFLDLLHRELRQPVYDWEQRDDCVQTVTASCSVGDTNETQIRRNSDSSTDSDRASTTAENFETADSGWSSDADGTSIIRARKRNRNSQLSTQDDDKSVVSTSASSCVMSVMNTKRVSTFKATKQRKPIRYRSIVTEVFDGRLRSSVKCLRCQHVSETTETFQDLSLSIPGKETIDRLPKERQHSSNSVSSDSVGTDTSAVSSMSSGIWRLATWMMYGWMGTLWNYMSGPTVTLENCLEAFFSADHLRGDDMYSCEKCSKLCNGVKMCRITKLPEILCIHLKRFRHDSTYNTKVNTAVTFPLDNLDLAAFTDSDMSGRVTQYELCAVISHYGGGADSGHYIAYCRNEMDENWYEFDDNVVSRVDAAEVLTKEAYVLFYQKKNDGMESIRDEYRSLSEMDTIAKSFGRFYISREWLQRFETFAEPGPITNYDFLCEHGLISPRRAMGDFSRYQVEVSGTVWDYLFKCFGGGPTCSALFYCLKCNSEHRRIEIRRDYEVKMFRQLEKRFKEDQMRCFGTGCLTQLNLISRSWFVRWENFACNIDYEPPSSIDNSSLLIRSTNDGHMRLRQGANYFRISRDMWRFFVDIYGGGPEVFYTFDIQPSVDEIDRIESEHRDYHRRLQQSDEVDELPIEQMESNEEPSRIESRSRSLSSRRSKTIESDLDNQQQQTCSSSTSV